jgi:hypothetical protein
VRKAEKGGVEESEIGSCCSSESPIGCFFFLEHDFTCHPIKKKKAERTASTTQLRGDPALVTNHRESGWEPNNNKHNETARKRET